MAIDYVLRFPCEVRKQFPEAQLVTMARQLGIAQFALGRLRQAYPDRDAQALAEQCQVEIAVDGPDGTARQVPVSVAQLFAMVAPLGPMRAHCGPCRANVSDRSFGCIAKVNYPISRETETWLLARLPDDEKNPNLALLLKFVADLGIDGAPVDALRAREAVFEAKAAPFRTWGGIFDRRKLTSSQLLHMLAFGGPIGPEQAELYTRLLGLDTILKERHPPSDQIEQFKTFFCGIVMAGRLKAAVDVDA